MHADEIRSDHETLHGDCAKEPGEQWWKGGSPLRHQTLSSHVIPSIWQRRRRLQHRPASPPVHCPLTASQHVLDREQQEAYVWYRPLTSRSQLGRCGETIVVDNGTTTHLQDRTDL
ncbi:hypothetical protein NPIL_99871 [Nephila pilipes]|uniref:Uncharacterized protein n=1 Tax=Nephila pilipes TaxID=299642 RepID=A0A8X6TNH3_NEPPI|nr:hypothetical protein NPIL_99871 [Nephila pilipes]